MAVLAQSAEICYTEPERKCFPVRCDCHIHMVLDGADWKRAIARHSGGVDEVWVRRVLETYRKLGFAYLRDGGDRWGAGVRDHYLIHYVVSGRGTFTAAGRAFPVRAGEVFLVWPNVVVSYEAGTPLSPLCAQGHYGGFIGEKYENLSQYAAMVTQKRAKGADFIKIMISGLMDFDRFGVLTEDGLPPETIRELIHIAHEEGFAVMAHANGARTVEAAALAGVDSVEHGAYLDTDALHAMRENGTVWVPTLSTIGNLRGMGRFDEAAVAAILESAMENVAAFAAMGGLIAPGTDAGAWAVPHGSLSEYALLEQVLGENAENILSRGAAECVFLDADRKSAAIAEGNFRRLGIGAKVTLTRAENYLSGNCGAFSVPGCAVGTARDGCFFTRFFCSCGEYLTFWLGSMILNPLLWCRGLR